MKKDQKSTNLNALINFSKERKMKMKYKIATLIALLGVISACSSESTPTYSDLGSDTYPQKFYVEYVPCTYGAN